MTLLLTNSRFFTLFIAGILFSIPVLASAQQSFSDVPPSHYAHGAIEYLKERGYVEGLGNGTFNPDGKTNRAEVAKFIFAPLADEATLVAAPHAPFSDSPADAWFAKYVSYGVSKRIIDDPSKKPAYNAAQNVVKVEFLKMLELAHGIDPNAYSEIYLPLANDVRDPSQWFYPYVRYALSSSMITADEAQNLHPAQELTRGQVSVILYRLLLYKEGLRTQRLLNIAEGEILRILASLEINELEAAEWASARALLAARGAHASKPDDSVVQGALKITEAFRALVKAYRAGVNQDLDAVIAHDGDAWNLAARAKELNSGMNTLADQVQTIAKNMADEARALQGTPAQ